MRVKPRDILSEHPSCPRPYGPSILASSLLENSPRKLPEIVKDKLDVVGNESVHLNLLYSRSSLIPISNMRWVSAFLALASIGALQANAQEATIFTFPAWSASSTNRHTQQQTITEDEARLVLELRMKPSLASNLGKVDADTVDRLNYFAQNDLLLFGGNNQESPQRSLVLLEGIDQHNGK